MKALHLHHGQEAWGHVVARLFDELPVDYERRSARQAKVLDGFYVPTRYPNGHPEGASFQHYGVLTRQIDLTQPRLYKFDREPRPNKPRKRRLSLRS